MNTNLNNGTPKRKSVLSGFAIPDAVLDEYFLELAKLLTRTPLERSQHAIKELPMYQFRCICRPLEIDEKLD